MWREEVHPHNRNSSKFPETPYQEMPKDTEHFVGLSND